jgi:hypothetical protein
MKLTWPPALEAAIRARCTRPEPLPDSWVYDEELPQGQKRRARPRRRDSGDGEMGEPLGRRILSEETVRRWLLRVRYQDRFRKGRDRVPLKVVAEFVGLNRDTLYEAINGGKISRVTRSRLSWVIDAIDQRQLTFKRRGQTWHLDFKDNPPPPSNPVQTISAAPFGSIFGGPPLPPWKTE